MGNDRLSGKQVGSQASRRVTRRLAWIQPVCISINAVPALKGLIILITQSVHVKFYFVQELLEGTVALLIRDFSKE